MGVHKFCPSSPVLLAASAYLGICAWMRGGVGVGWGVGVGKEEATLSPTEIRWTVSFLPPFKKKC